MRQNNKKYALKEMSKVKIIDKHSEESIKGERDFLSKLNHPFIVNMHYAFQDFDNLYLVMDLLKGGDLRYHLWKNYQFQEDESKFFIACLILSLEYIHNNNIIHRDIKPENLVCDENGYLRLTDFGVAKIRKKDNKNETSGTPGYMAPEVLMAKNHSFPVDFFAIGVMGYEFMFGQRPYLGKNRKEYKESILNKQAYIDKDDIDEDWSDESVDFINRCLKRKVSKRLGYTFGIKELKEHPWFNEFNWNELFNKKMKAPFLPKSGGNFDKKFCNEIERISEETMERYQCYINDEGYSCLFRGYTFFNSDDYNQNLLKENKDIIGFKKITNFNINNNHNDNHKMKRIIQFGKFKENNLSSIKINHKFKIKPININQEDNNNNMLVNLRPLNFKIGSKLRNYKSYSKLIINDETNQENENILNIREKNKSIDNNYANIINPKNSRNNNIRIGLYKNPYLKNSFEFPFKRSLNSNIESNTNIVSQNIENNKPNINIDINNNKYKIPSIQIISNENMGSPSKNNSYIQYNIIQNNNYNHIKNLNCLTPLNLVNESQSIDVFTRSNKNKNSLIIPDLNCNKNNLSSSIKLPKLNSQRSKIIIDENDSNNKDVKYNKINFKLSSLKSKKKIIENLKNTKSKKTLSHSQSTGLLLNSLIKSK